MITNSRELYPTPNNGEIQDPESRLVSGVEDFQVSPEVAAYVVDKLPKDTPDSAAASAARRIGMEAGNNLELVELIMRRDRLQQKFDRPGYHDHTDEEKHVFEDRMVEIRENIHDLKVQLGLEPESS